MQGKLPETAASEVREPDLSPPTVAAPPPALFERQARWLRGRRSPSPARQSLLAFVAYLVVFVSVAGLPLLRHLSVPNIRQYWTDEQFYAWSLGWWPYALSHGINPLFTNQIGAPHGYDLAWASTAPAVDLAMWPVTAVFGAVVSYNLVLLIVPPVSAWAAFLAARQLTGRFWASLAAGTVYGFCPFELTHNWQGQPNLTMIALFPLMLYLVLLWWHGTLEPVTFVSWMAIAMTLQFYTFNEGFLQLTVVGAGALVTGFAVAGSAELPKVARLAGLTGIAYAGAVVAAAPYLIYSLLHYQGVLTRQQPAYSLPLIRLIVPTSEQMFGLTPLIGYSNQIGRTGIENYAGIPLLIVLLLMAVSDWRSRISRLLAIVFAFVIAIAVGPNLAITSIRHTYPLPWGGLWSLPFARSAEPSRFIVFAVLVLAVALAVWLAAPARSPRVSMGRWCLGLLAVASIITDTPTAYQAINPVPPDYKPAASAHPANQLPPFVTQGQYRRYLRPGESVAILTHRGNAGMLFQVASDFYFRIAGGYINASLTPVNALPPAVAQLAHPGKRTDLAFEDYARASGLGALVVERAWADPWMNRLSRLGLHGTTTGGVTIYPIRPWLARPAPRHRQSSFGRAKGTHATQQTRGQVPPLRLGQHRRARQRRGGDPAGGSRTEDGADFLIHDSFLSSG